MLRCFVKVCRRRGLKVYAGKSKVMVSGGEEGLDCEVCLVGIYLEHISEFKYLGYVLDKSGTDEGDCSRKVTSGRGVAVAIRSLVIAIEYCSFSMLGSCISYSGACSYVW